MNTLKAIAITILLIFQPIIPLILLVLFALLFDTILGIIAAKVNGEPLVSNKFYRMLTKAFIFLGIISLTFGIDYLLLDIFLYKKVGFHFAATIFAAVLITVNEGFSMDEKIRKMNKGKGVKFYFKRLLNLSKTLNKDLKELKKDTKDLLKDEDSNSDAK